MNYLPDTDHISVLRQSGPDDVAPTMDLRSASIGLSGGLILVTPNVGDFHQVPDLVTEDKTVWRVSTQPCMPANMLVPEAASPVLQIMDGVPGATAACTIGAIARSGGSGTQFLRQL